MSRMTGGQAVIRSLKAHNVDPFFGIISIHNLALFDALYGEQDDLQYIGGRLELACGYMADGYARATGKPGVFLTSTGPGAADSVGAMGEAYHSASPVLQLTTNVEKAFINSGRGVTHEPKNQLEMFRSVTDWNALIPNVESIHDYVNQAFYRFRTRRPRPIELEIPTDVLSETADVEIFRPPEPEAPQGDPAMIEKAAQELMKARRPIIFAGDEAMYSDATQELIRLAEALGAPVVTGDGAKGVFPEDHPLSLGPAMGKRIWGENPVLEFISTCDVALVVGSPLPYRSTAGVGLKMPQRLVHILLDEQIVGKNYPATVPIVADSKAAITQLLTLLAGKDIYKGDAYRSEVQQMKASIYEALKRSWPNELRALEAIRSAMPRDTVTVWDITVPTSRAIRCLPIYEPRTFMYPHGWVGIGFGFPAALGAKAGMPHRRVVCFTGDGGFQYNMQELGTAVQYNISPVVVLFNDNAWGVLKERQVDTYGGRLIGIDLLNPDFVKLAEAYGIPATRVNTVERLVKALHSALRHDDKIQLIEVQIPSGFANFT